MSGTNLLSSQPKGAAPAAAAAGGTSANGAGAAGGGAAASSAGTPFDAILMLEEIAAAATEAEIDAGAAELGTDVREAGSDDSADDEDNLEADDPLAFLAGLMAVAPSPHAHPSHATAGEGGPAEAGSFAAVTTADGDPTGAPFLADPDTGAMPGKADDAALAARALAAQAVLPTNESKAGDERSVAPRAVDLLTQTSRPAPTTDHAPIATHVRDPRWAEEFGARVALLVNQRESIAAISLTPVDLGPVDVSVTVRDSQATIHFGAAQAETRALIEASLPKLRELLAAQGFQLLDASVSHGFTRQRNSDAPSIPRPSGADDPTPVETRTRLLNGLLDTYA